MHSRLGLCELATSWARLSQSAGASSRLAFIDGTADLINSRRSLRSVFTICRCAVTTGQRGRTSSSLGPKRRPTPGRIKRGSCQFVCSFLKLSNQFRPLRLEPVHRPAPCPPARPPVCLSGGCCCCCCDTWQRARGMRAGEINIREKVWARTNLPSAPNETVRKFRSITQALAHSTRQMSAHSLSADSLVSQSKRLVLWREAAAKLAGFPARPAQVFVGFGPAWRPPGRPADGGEEIKQCHLQALSTRGGEDASGGGGGGGTCGECKQSKVA